MGADAPPFVVGQIRGISPALHSTERRPPLCSRRSFQTVSRREILRSSALPWCLDVFCAMAHIHPLHAVISYNRCVQRGRRVRGRDRYLPSPPRSGSATPPTTCL